MKAVQFIGVGKPAQVVEVPKPEPKPGEVLVKIGGAGVCHSDLHVLDHGIGINHPFILGHENAGWVAAVGAGVQGWKEGDAGTVTRACSPLKIIARTGIPVSLTGAVWAPMAEWPST